MWRSLGRGKLYALKAVWQIKGEGYREEALCKGWTGNLSNHFFVVMRAFFAGSVKAPAKMYGPVIISFKDDGKDVFFVEKKLQRESLMVDLVGLSPGKFRDFHWIGNDSS